MPFGGRRAVPSRCGLVACLLARQGDAGGAYGDQRCPLDFLSLPQVLNAPIHLSLM
jgi:hypothetical protein